jgi:aspartate/methionine/tyrosine aminotransferase
MLRARRTIVIGDYPTLPGIGRVTESRIRRLTIEAVHHNATNLAQAFPDYAAPKCFVEALISAATANSHQYTDTWGTYETRRAVADYVHRFHRSICPDADKNVLITIGAMEAMNDALSVVLNPGDEAIVLEPYYECFVAQILSRHGVPRHVRLPEDGSGGFELDLGRLESACNERTRAVIVNSPSNPGGKVFSRSEMLALLEVCRRRGIWLLSDETYEHIYFDGHRPVSVIDVDPGLSNSVLIGGFGKTFAVTGWRAGYMVANEEFMRAVRPYHDVNTICAVSHVQQAIITLVQSPDEYFQKLRAEYHARRELLVAGLERLGFGVNRIEGAYYVFAELPAWWQSDASDFNAKLTERGFVAGVPGEVFYGPGGGGRRIRYTFCKQRTTIERALSQIESAFEVFRSAR